MKIDTLMPALPVKAAAGQKPIGFAEVADGQKPTYPTADRLPNAVSGGMSREASLSKVAYPPAPASLISDVTDWSTSSSTKTRPSSV